MELSRAHEQASYLIKKYQHPQIVVNNLTYECPIVVMPEDLIIPWGPKDFDSLEAQHFECLLPFHVEVVLLGSGPTLRFPPVNVFSILIQNKIGFEIMDTKAACRTYQILIAEGRRVAAALIN